MSLETLLERLLNELPGRIAAALRQEATAPLTVTAAARALKLRRGVLLRAVQAGKVKTIPWGQHPRIPPEEVDRLRREGLEPEKRRRRSPRGTREELIRALPID